MTKNEFMTQLTNELHKKRIADAADIIEEYEQHFTFKLADGFSEEEIAAKLGNPTTLAEQFAGMDVPQKSKGIKPLVVAGLCFADIFVGLLFIFFAAWGVVMIAAALSSLTIAGCLLFNANIFNLIPTIPYGSGVIIAVAFTALSVLIAVGCIYYGALLRQAARAFGRFHYNALANASEKAPLPALSINPRFSAKTNRKMRNVALISLLIFAACFVLSYIVCSIAAGSLEFWHVWGWFAN